MICVRVDLDVDPERRGLTVVSVVWLLFIVGILRLDADLLPIYHMQN